MEKEFFFFLREIDSLKFCKLVAFLFLILKLIFEFHNGVEIVIFSRNTKNYANREFKTICVLISQITIIFFL